MLLGDWLGYLDKLDLAKNVGNKIGFSDVKLPFTKLGYMGGISLGTYDGTVLRYL